MMKNSDQPANPAPYQNSDGTVQHDVYLGITKREYFAAMAMQGMLANPEIFRMFPKSNPNTLMSMVSLVAIEHADSLLIELEKPITK